MKQSNRREVLVALMTLTTPLPQISKQLAQFGWDSQEELATIKRVHVASALSRYLNQELSASDIEHWANLIEGRDDLGLEPECSVLLQEILHELANPALTRELTRDIAKQWLTMLS